MPMAGRAVPRPMAESSDAQLHRIEEAAARVRARASDAGVDVAPSVGLVLGTGLGGVAEALTSHLVIGYDDLPHFPLSTVESHSGKLILGSLNGTPVVALQGRFHCYEGYTAKEVAFPVRVMKMLGVDTLVLSGACGGMHPLWAPGDLVLLDDHINLLGDNPLVGPNLDGLGPRFPDMSAPYDRELQSMALQAAMGLGIPLRRGVYAAVLGPNLETRAEYRMLRAFGADVVGMSTVPEVIVARHMGMKVLAISIITDQCLPDALEPVDVPAIIATARAAEPSLTALITAVVARL